MPSKRPQSGFTLVELLIVLAVIAIIVAIALPNLLTARIATHETAAIKTMKLIIEAQVHFVSTCVADEDVNGVGEYGTFAEMAGSLPIREAAGGTAFLAPNLISPAFRVITPQGEMSRGGYYFKIFLPGSNGDGIPEQPGGGASIAIDPKLCEGLWCVYAWPKSYENTGRRTFFANQAGTILFTEDAAYSGPAAMNSPGAAFEPPGPPGRIDGRMALSGTGRDGNIWRTVNN